MTYNLQRAPATGWRETEETPRTRVRRAVTVQVREGGNDLDDEKTQESRYVWKVRLTGMACGLRYGS